MDLFQISTDSTVYSLQHSFLMELVVQSYIVKQLVSHLATLNQWMESMRKLLKSKTTRVDSLSDSVCSVKRKLEDAISQANASTVQHFYNLQRSSNSSATNQSKDHYFRVVLSDRIPSFGWGCFFLSAAKVAKVFRYFKWASGEIGYHTALAMRSSQFESACVHQHL